MHEGCAYPSPWRGNFMAQFEAAEVDTAFLPYPCLDFPHCSANPDLNSAPFAQHCKRRDTSLCGKDKKEHSLPLVVVTRSFSPLSTALTANKEILPIWQNISRVTFHKAGFMHCEKQGAELISRAWAEQGWSCSILCIHTGCKVDSRAAFHTLDSPGEGWSCPAQLQELGEDVTEAEPAWAASSKLHQSQLQLLNQGGLGCCSHSCLGCSFRLFRVGRSLCGYCEWIFHTRHCCCVNSSESLGSEASLSSSAATTPEHHPNTNFFLLLIHVLQCFRHIQYISTPSCRQNWFYFYAEALPENFIT